MSDNSLYRYDQRLVPNGLQGEEGAFLMFDKILGYATHLGLYTEQIGPHGEALGTFPQAFTHLSLISAAYNLDRALDRNPAGPHR